MKNKISLSTQLVAPGARRRRALALFGPSLIGCSMELKSNQVHLLKYIQVLVPSVQFCGTLTLLSIFVTYIPLQLVIDSFNYLLLC